MRRRNGARIRRRRAAKWRFRSGKDRSTTVRAHGEAVCFVTDGVLYCLDAATGAKRWKSEREWRDHTLRVSGDTAYLSSWDDKLYTLRLDDGGQRWTRPANGFLPGPPAVDASKRLLYLVAQDKAMALGMDDGRARWTSPVQDDGLESAHRPCWPATRSTSAGATGWCTR